MHVNDIAEICHEANRALCHIHGDDSQERWTEAEAWQRQSAVNGVRFVQANPDAPDSAIHDAWMVEKEERGWIYGEVKNAEAQTHPCLVPFEELPEHQQAKDKLFKAIVLALS